jgi:ElaA protein
VIRVELAQADELARCLAIRRRVFVDEQGVAPADEQDGRDADCLHWLAWQDGEAVGTARLRAVPGGQKAERVAVLPAFRDRGVGAALMRALEACAWQRGAAQLLLHAQSDAVPFYLRLGYTIEGPAFAEAGIPHRKMSKARPAV